MNTQEVIKEFKDNLGPLIEKRLEGNIQVNRRWYDGHYGVIELCVTTYYKGEHITEVGIYWQPNHATIIPAEADKFIWLEPYIQDIIEAMKVEFTLDDLLNHSVKKLAFHKALRDAVLPEV